MRRAAEQSPRRVRFARRVQKEREDRRGPERRDGGEEEKKEEEDVDMVALRSTLHPVLQWDLDAVRWLVRCRETNPWLQSLVMATTSKFRTQDISLVLWLVFLAMLPEFGLPYMWICVVNLLVVVLIQFFAQVLRPIDVDRSLYGLPICTDADTYGFPCMDAHMSIVVLLPVIENTQSLVARLAFSLIIAFIAATRLLLGARFISQIIASWLTGLTGLIVGNHGRVIVKTYKLSSGHNTAAIVTLVAFLMVVVGQWVENNESRVIGVPRADFLQVLTNILRSDGAPTATTATGTTPTPAAAAAGGAGPSARVHQFSQSRYATEDERASEDGRASEEMELLGKKDSFYFLMQGMRSRARGPPPPQPL